MLIIQPISREKERVIESLGFHDQPTKKNGPETAETNFISISLS